MIIAVMSLIIKHLYNLHDNVTRCLTDASSSLFKHKRGNYTCQSGWTIYVADSHKSTNEAFQLLNSIGKPKQGI